MGRDANKQGALRFLANLPPAGRYHPYIPQPGEVRYEELKLGDQVEVKSAADLEKVFTTPNSQWAKGFGKSVKNQTKPRAAFAGQQAFVKSLDPADKTIQLARTNTGTEGKTDLVWFSPEMLARIIGQGPNANPASSLAAGPQAPVETPIQQIAVSESLADAV